MDKNREPLIVSGGGDGAIRSWLLDGSPGPLDLPNAHTNWIRALVVLDHDGEPLIVSGDDDGAIRSWLLDGSPGPLDLPNAHTNWIGALTASTKTANR